MATAETLCESSSAPPPGRHDGFTPERQTLFLDALAACGSVAAAAEAAGVSRTAVYNLRNRDSTEAEAFRAAWDARLKQAVAVLAETAFDRAIRGVAEPVFHKGEQVGERIRHNDRLLMFLLKTLDPDTYAPRAAAAAPVSTLSTSAAPPAPRRPSTPASKRAAFVSTSSTYDDVDPDDDAAWEAIAREETRAGLRELRNTEPPPFTSKRNARRLAAKQRRGGGGG